MPKRGRGRPKKHTDAPPPPQCDATSAEWTKAEPVKVTYERREGKATDHEVI